MPMTPHKDETQSEFMARCVPDMIGSGDDKRPQDQATAICLDIWKNKSAPLSLARALRQVKQIPEPDPGETHSEFMDRCLEETDDEEACQMAWEDRRISEVMHKTHEGQHDGAEYVLSDESTDRMGDIITAGGWRLDNFKRNPIALFGHRSDFVIGRWRNLRVEKGELRGHLELAPAGTSDRIDEIRKLVEAGILKATSVGFRPIKHEPINPESPWDGTRFLEHELVETSLVSVPANPNALAVARGLDISRDTLALVFAGQGEKGERRVTRGLNGGQAKTSPNGKVKAMSLAQTITETQEQLKALREGLEQHLASLDNNNVSDEQMNRTDEFHTTIARKQRLLDQQVASEKALGLATAQEQPAHEIRMPTRHVAKPNGGGEAPVRVFAEAKDPYVPGDITWKAITCLVRMQGDRGRKQSHLDVIRETYGEDEKIRNVYDALIGKAATVPALTSVAGWAQELVRIDIQGFMESLQPAAVAARLFARGVSFTFGNNGIISIPSRSATPTIAGSFVGEGAPIPVRQGAFTAIQLVPKKMAVITVFSREISEHSTPQIEGLLRQAITEDTTVAIDSVLMDTNAATAVRPPGLRSGVSTLTPTAGGGFTAVVGDVKLLVGALTTSTLGNLRNPVWLMTPALELALRLTVAPNGTFAFAGEIGNGTFAGYPIIVSANVTADTLFLVDAADIVSASGAPRFDVSDSATVHMEDTTPLPIGSTGTPNTVAAPVRSFWQTDTLGIRMTMPLNWSVRRTGMVQYITGVTWK